MFPWQFPLRKKESEPEMYREFPVRSIAVGPAQRGIAVHVHGRLGYDSQPLVCLPGYTRNMLDFAALPLALSRTPASGAPIILLDLPGRGRSAWLGKRERYSSLCDADCVADVLTALGISSAIVLGQGHGGQVAMALARHRPTLIAATILIDSGPVTDPRGLVRTRNNLRYIADMRSQKAAREALRKMLGADYPGETPARLDQLADRQFRFDARGRPKGLYDPRLVDQLEQFDFDDVLEPQWALFDCLGHAPLLLMRTQLSDQLRRETFDEMIRRRSDAVSLSIPGQGSPALLEGGEEVEAIAAFLSHASSSQPHLAEAG